MNLNVIKPPSGTRCCYCYSEAAKAGRPVRKIDICDYEICTLCETRLREGLLYYIPSNGTEFDIFQEQCDRCRFGGTHPEHGCPTCAHGIIERLMDSAWEGDDSMKKWWMPDVLRTRGEDGHHLCPADCLKFSDRSNDDGMGNKPPPPDCIGQMMLWEAVPAPVEVVPKLAEVLP